MSVFVGVPIKNCGFWLSRFLQQLDGLSDVSRVVLIYGQSSDATLDVVTQWMVYTEHDVELYRESSLMKAESSAQISAIYRDFQSLMKDGDEEHALLLDADIMKVPRNLIQKLKKYDKDIIAPYVWIKDHNPRRFYDVFVFRTGGCRFHPFDPPMNNNNLFRLESVGTCLLVKRKPFIEIPYRDPYPHMSFCSDARVQGYEVWADPKTTIEHLDLTRLGIFHFPMNVPGSPERFIKNDGTIIDGNQLEIDILESVVWGDTARPQ
jgi:hypothetical protein